MPNRIRMLYCILPFFLFSHVAYGKLVAPPKAKPFELNVKQSKKTKLNINRATAKEIAKHVKGIGIRRAQNIVKFRKENGDFKTVEDLMFVRGISKHFVDTNISVLQQTLTLK